MAFLACMLVCSNGFTQSNGEQAKANLSFEKLDWHNAYIKSANAAGLATLDKVFPDYNSFAEANISYKQGNGDFCGPYDPAKTTEISFHTQAIRKVQKAFVMGYFTYSLENRIGAQWNGLFIPGSNPFFMADSVKGKFRSETFRTGMKYAHPLTRNQIIGISMDYTTAKGAKNKDLRNENAYMDFVVRPSWLWNQKALSLGLDVGYHRTLEEIEYRKIQTNENKIFYQFRGNWFYLSETFASETDNKRIKTDNAFDGHFQISYQSDKFSIYNEFGVEKSEGSQKNSAINNKQFGDVEAMQFGDHLVIHFLKNHRLSGYYNRKDLLGYQILQLEEEISPQNKVWVTYDRFNVYVASEETQNVAYSYLQRREGLDISWQIDLGVSMFQRMQKYKIYPYEFVQDISTTEVYLGFNKNLKFGRTTLDICPQIAYGTGDGEKNRKGYMAEETTLEESENWQLHSMLDLEYNMLTCDKLRTQIKLKCAYDLRKSHTKIYAFVNYDFIKPINADDIFGHQTRNFLTLGLGFSF
ncbi:MAG: hypothetical protein LBU91_01705 [Bacteroidales bacterium]|jgi:hypothetical protein|nr:hypothetical protein [Bacteroidales bacterium]